MKKNSNIIVTISRESGSGGKHIGQLLAEKMGVKCYDKELLEVVSEESGYSKEILETHDEKPNNSFLYSLVADTYSMGFNTPGVMELPLNQKIFLAQFDAIRKLAQRESCVIVGRCADYVLEEYESVLSIFVTADFETRLAYIMEQESLSKHKARDFITKTDKRRSSYYNYYSDKKWGIAKSYDLCINSAVFGHEETAEILHQIVKTSFY